MTKVLLFQPIFNLVVALYKLVGGNLGLSIILVAIFSRLVTLPIMLKQLKSAGTMKDLAPEIEKLKKKHKNDKQKLNEAQLKLYKEKGFNPVGGCLPMIVQLVFLIQVRSVVVTLINEGVSSFNSLAYFGFLKFAEGYKIDLNFLGMNLGKVAADFSWSDPQIIPYVILALLVGLTQVFSTKLLMPSTAPKKEDKSKKKKNGKDDDIPSMKSMTGMMNTQMTYLLPAFTVIMALGYSGGSSLFSAALSIFWTVQNLFVIIQRLIVSPEARLNLMSKIRKPSLMKE